MKKILKTLFIIIVVVQALILSSCFAKLKPASEDEVVGTWCGTSDNRLVMRLYSDKTLSTNYFNFGDDAELRWSISQEDLDVQYAEIFEISSANVVNIKFIDPQKPNDESCYKFIFLDGGNFMMIPYGYKIDSMFVVERNLMKIHEGMMMKISTSPEFKF